MSDVVSIRSTIQEYAVVNCNADKTEDEIENDVINRLKGRLLLCKIEKVNSTKNKNIGSIEVKIYSKFFYSSLSAEKKIRVNMKNEDNRQFLVECKVVIDTIKGIENKNGNKVSS